jgi:formamidopyrimidine-DNA glycosylase
MPELPEVETMVRGLRPVLEGQTLSSAALTDPSLLQNVGPAALESTLSGATVETVARRGKWVVITLAGSRGIIVIQPRMTGGFWLVEPDRKDHVRLLLRLQDDSRIVWFCDTRRLGKIAWYPNLEAAHSAFSASHGPDALEIDRESLAQRLKRTTRAIKPTLMDQKVLAGIGNIYADEILFQSRIHPARSANSLKPAEIARLHPAITSVLYAAIAAEGSSFDSGYRTVLGLEGGFLASNAMYGRGGQPCPGCQSPVVKVYMEGLKNRPTHFCAVCQKLPKSQRTLAGPSGRRKPHRVE